MVGQMLPPGIWDDVVRVMRRLREELVMGDIAELGREVDTRERKDSCERKGSCERKKCHYLDERS